jgi:hypothetical protein
MANKNQFNGIKPFGLKARSKSDGIGQRQKCPGAVVTAPSN